MYTEEEILYHAFKISQTRDDQLMHRNTNAFQAEREEKRQKKDEARKEKMYGKNMQQTYTAKYGDPNDPWKKENSWKEKRRQELLTYKMDPVSIYTRRAQPDKLSLASLDDIEKTYKILVDNKMNHIPSHIDAILKDLSQARQNNRARGSNSTFANKKDEKIDAAQMNTLKSYIHKLETECNNELAETYGWDSKRAGKIWYGHHYDKTRSNIVKDALTNKYNIPLHYCDILFTERSGENRYDWQGIY